VLYVMDYKVFFNACVDSKLGKLHKEELTQHQWSFEAVTPDPHFPLGAKTCYRAYSADKVVEFVFQDKELCSTPIGMYTGLEPRTCLCRWYPAPDGEGMDPHRPGIEGLYLLRDLPRLSSRRAVILSPYQVGCKKDLDTTMAEISSV